ncbi:MAG: hypothetical protein NT062_02295 [Proteobacteria bacterium]|nr:hypothetical protein [Pseudomonadota bacterium]
MRTSYLASLLLVTACADAPIDLEGGAADIQGEDAKADGTVGIEVTARIAPGTTDLLLTAAAPRLGYVVYVAEGSTAGFEVTRTGSAAGLDTQLKVYGPRLGDGSYPKTLASDEDAGYGKLSKTGFTAPLGGFYLVEVAGTALTTSKKARLAFTCTGTCVTDAPVAPLGNDLKWYQRSAERRALQLQAYGVASARIAERAAAGLPTSWGVVLDIDETSVDNSAYQHSRADLGVGFSPASWTAWVNKKAATPVAGVLAFTNEVKQLGGKVVLVSNRKAATECAATQDNLHAIGMTFDEMLCQDTTSDKNPRFDAVAARMEVVMFVGDNIQDFPKLTQDVRKQPDDAFAKFGESFILIPNPMYGSWEKNVD